ncbi:hypothetical protein [Vannielia litorea]|uniref:hypothetical protein n=1 Tax=Vannielia litorea TaxID=1217970 RepID=UPI001BCD374D|nr:hypothetical protein [Vannielia litorea]MBS8227138.1 hypothetical protein [Vannielia litorea]
MHFTDLQKHEAARREAELRRRVYPRWVADGRMTQAEADRQIAVMEAIAADYAPPDLFGAVAA